MKGTEAERRLRKSGAVKIRRTAGGHDIWRLATGETRMFALAHEPVNRNAIARIHQAERLAALRDHKKDLMMTTAADQVEHAASIIEATIVEPTIIEPMISSAGKGARTEGAIPEIRVYRSAGTKPAIELLLNETMASLLGFPETVEVNHDSLGVWRLKPGGASRVRRERGRDGAHYRISAKVLKDVVPVTGRTAMPSERTADGLILYPERVEAVQPRHRGRWSKRQLTPAKDRTETKPRQNAVEARQTATAAARPMASPKPSSPAGGASTAQQATSSPSRWGTAVDDLKAALEMLRGTLAEHGAILHEPDGKVIDLTAVHVVMKVTL